MIKFAERLKELRRDKKLSQRDLSKAVGLSQNAITQWETGKCVPVATAVVVLADFFEVTADYLLGRTDE